MRSLRSATCTSGDPVSPSWVLYVLMTSVLRSLLNTMDPSTHGPDIDAECAAPGPPLSVFLDGSVFYLSTSRGCKSPSGRPSATDRTSPLASRTLTRSSYSTAEATAR